MYATAYDLAQALHWGRETVFEYWHKNDPPEPIEVKRHGDGWFTLTRRSTGKTAKAYQLTNLIDF